MTLAIVGLGAIGGSFAMSLMKNSSEHIIGIDIDEQTIAYALEQKMIHEGTTQAEDALSQADIVMLTLYPSQVAPYIEKYKSYFKKGVVFTDVTGIKTSIIKEVTPVLPDQADFVFAHPMRGSEKKGISGASIDKFEGANALITPVPLNQTENIDKIEALYRKAGFTTITRVTPEKHDEQIAYVSQLMHALSVSVVNSKQASDDTLLFAGNSFKELTRIADINVDLWSELFLYNRQALLESIDCFEQELSTLKKALQSWDEEKADSNADLKTFLTRSRDQRREWY